jgi:endonuclease I
MAMRPPKFRRQRSTFLVVGSSDALYDASEMRRILTLLRRRSDRRPPGIRDLLRSACLPKVSHWQILAGVSAVVLPAAEPPGYYAAAEGLTGSALRGALHDIVTRPHRPLSYTATRAAIEYCDEDPANAARVLLVYTRRSEAKTNFVRSPPQNDGEWNREHLWPNSAGLNSSGADYADLNNLRAADATVNNTRGNFPFDETTAGVTARVPADDEAPLCTSDSDSWEPPPEMKGDIARAMLYMELRYDGETADEADLRLTDDQSLTGGSLPYSGRLTTLLLWHYADPVSTAESRRNDRVHERQGNRNPFVDRPAWVESLWGNPADLAVARTGQSLVFSWGLGLQQAMLETRRSPAEAWTSANGTAGINGNQRTFSVIPPVADHRRFYRLRFRGIEAP